MGEAYKMRNLLECFKGDVRHRRLPRAHLLRGRRRRGRVCGVERVCVRHDGAALPDLAADACASTTATPTCGTRCGRCQRRRLEGVQDAARVRGHLRRVQRRSCAAAPSSTGVHPRGQGARHGLHRVNGFEQKISAGNAMQLISRDLYRVAKGVDLYRLLSMFFTGTGFYLSTMITIWSVSILMLCHLVLMLTGSSEYDQYMWNNDPLAKSVGGGGHRRQLDASARQLDDGAPTSQEVLISCVAAGAAVALLVCCGAWRHGRRRGSRPRLPSERVTRRRSTSSPRGRRPNPNPHLNPRPTAQPMT